MTKRKEAIGITHQTGKGFKKCVGWYLHPDGRKLPKVHWLGHDPEHARFLAFTLQKAWPGVEATGRGWTSEDVTNVKAFVGEYARLFSDAAKDMNEQQKRLDERRTLLKTFAFIVPGESLSDPVVEKTDVSQLPPQGAAVQVSTLYDAIDEYLKSLRGKPRSESHKERADRVLNVNLKAARKDCPLAEIDFIWLDRLCDYFKARPNSLKDGTRISATTVLVILRYLRAFFTWVDDTGYGDWVGPRKLYKPFRVRVDDLMSPEEKREASVIKQFDIPALKKLYSVGSDFQRSVMLTALFCGLTQQELAVLKKTEFDLSHNTLHHFRNKTGVEGRFWLPDELVRLLRNQFKKAPDELAFRGADGNPLVMYKGNRQTSDTVRQLWDDLRHRAKTPDALSFKFLRKYLADFCMRHGGEAMGMVAMAHAPQTVLSKNYTKARQFDSFNELQRRMYSELKAAGFFTVKSQSSTAQITKKA